MIALELLIIAKLVDKIEFDGNLVVVDRLSVIVEIEIQCEFQPQSRTAFEQQYVERQYVLSHKAVDNLTYVKLSLRSVGVNSRSESKVNCEINIRKRKFAYLHFVNCRNIHIAGSIAQVQRQLNFVCSSVTVSYRIQNQIGKFSVYVKVCVDIKICLRYYFEEIVEYYIQIQRKVAQIERAQNTACVLQQISELNLHTYVFEHLGLRIVSSDRVLKKQTYYKIQYGIYRQSYFFGHQIVEHRNQFAEQFRTFLHHSDEIIHIEVRQIQQRSVIAEFVFSEV